MHKNWNRFFDLWISVFERHDNNVETNRTKHTLVNGYNKEKHHLNIHLTEHVTVGQFHVKFGFLTNVFYTTTCLLCGGERFKNLVLNKNWFRKFDKTGNAYIHCL